MKFAKNFLAVAALLAITIVASGCKDPYGSCVKVSKSIAAGITQAEQTLPGLQETGLFSLEEEKNVMAYLDGANTFNGQFQTCVDAVHQAKGSVAGLIACVNGFAAGLTSPAELSLLHVKNERAQAQVHIWAGAIQIGLSGLAAGLR